MHRMRILGRLDVLWAAIVGLTLDALLACSVATVAAALLVARPAHAIDYVNDPLTAASFAGRGSVGGTFSASGWTVTGDDDTVWYEITDALPTGRVEYTATGLSLATSVTGVEHDLLTMYQAGTGIAEPMPYDPYYRNNDFKVFTRIFGPGVPARLGSMKLELAFCPRGEPGYHTEVCPAECDRSGLMYSNNNYDDLGWDQGTAYRMAVAWSSGQMTFYRDQVALGTVSFPGEWAPQPLRVRLGSPRHDGIYPGEVFMPPGMTIRDVLIQGTAGTMTPACEVVVVDGGVPDAGTPPTEIAVLADVTAASWEAGVFPDVTDLNVEADALGQPNAIAYLRFPAQPGPVTSALLHVHTHAYGSAAGGSGWVCRVDDDTWDENTMTWATHPAVGSSCVGESLSVDPDVELGWDVTSLVTEGARVNLAIVSNDSDGVHYLSKEAGAALDAPHLVVALGAGGSGGAGGDGASGGSGQGAGAQGGSGQGAGATPPGSSANGDEESGCGCRSAGRRSPSMLAIGAVALLALATATHRRAPRARARR